MKIVLLLCVLSVLLLQIHASPVKLPERQTRAVSRQQGTVAAQNDVATAAASSDDDEDDEDDDDEPDLGDLVDDDDDDDDEEDDDDDDDEDDTPQGQAAPAAGAASDDDEEDDDDDYLDRLFDDILGDDDDEDDDDDVSPAASVQNPVSAAVAPSEDIAPAATQGAAVGPGIADGVDLPLESGNAADVASVAAAQDELASSLAASNNNANNEGALKNNIIDMSTDAFQERHNSFIDSIFMRINRIVSDNYDPFVVRLNGRAAGTITNAAATATKTKSTVTTSSSADTKASKKSINTKSEPRLSYFEPNKVYNQEIIENAKINENDKQQDKIASEMRTVSAKDNENLLTGDEKLTRSSTPTNGNGNNKKQQGKKANNSNKKDGKLKQNGSNQKDNGKQAEKLEKAEGSLSGLASLKRVGNVKVTSDAGGRNSTMKAKFSLGPLILRVEKSFKRGSVRNVKSATARTNEMIGRIKFSVVNDRATLMSIKVQQPKQVEVESKDNHDRTREFVWRRTPKIAKLVNEKLKLAAEAIFTPKGVEVVRL